ncbi:MAG: TetR/AcrR family transcriptional regulator [Myxococcota bacterium]|nr:TetR/AcrR family transcriptional regulator [Myxococcota bacterium]
MAHAVTYPSGKRERILAAAYRVCESHGVEGARMDAVAAIAQVSKGTLYRYFQSKEELLLATILDSYEQSLGFQPTAESGGTAGDQIGALVDYLVRVFERITPRMRVHYQVWGIVTARPELGEKLYAFLRRFHSERDAEIRAVLLEGRRAGVLRTDTDLDAIVAGVQALLAGFFYRATFDAEHTKPERFRSSLEALLAETVLPVESGGDGSA